MEKAQRGIMNTCSTKIKILKETLCCICGTEIRSVCMMSDSYFTAVLICEYCADIIILMDRYGIEVPVPLSQIHTRN